MLACQLQQRCVSGHRRGVETVRTTTFAARDLGVKMLTLYAFSVENWKRPQDEVGGLMSLLEYYLKKELATFVRDRVRFRTIGDVTCTGAVESPAATLDDIIAEVAAARQTERDTRADDQRSESAMEDRKKEGYF